MLWWKTFFSNKEIVLKEYRELKIEKILRDTEKAILVKYGAKEIWIPKSQIKKIKKDKLIIRYWLYNKILNNSF